jgi:hypothetical protein
MWRHKPWLRKTSNPNKPHPCNGKLIPLPLWVVQGWHPLSGLWLEGILLRATTQSSPLDSNTNLKKCQKSFSTCHGARFASMNWLTILVSSGLSVTWHGGWTRWDLDFFGLVVRVLLERWTPANSLLPQWHRVGVFFSLGLYLWQKPLYFLAQSSKRIRKNENWKY